MGGLAFLACQSAFLINLDLTIGIAVYNGEKFIASCLESIVKNIDPDLSFEIVVVDDASTDQTAQIVQKDFPQVKLIQHHTNKGLAVSTNHAVKNGSGRYHLRLDADTQVKSAAIRKLVEFMDENPRVGVVGPRLIYPNGKLQPSARLGWPAPGFVFWEFALPINKFLSRWINIEKTVGDLSQPTRAAHLTGAAMLLRREAIHQAGLMDPRIAFFRDETDWQLRITQAGWEIWYLPAAQVIHQGGQSSGGNYLLANDRNLHSFWSFNKKHYPGFLNRLRFTMAVFAGSVLGLVTGLALYIPSRFHSRLKMIINRTIKSSVFVIRWHFNNAALKSF